ncbi:hypothetical protein HDU77_005963 [Chytriomyces hyalinus]|nr:hypothetical protein HDU77_005963 [Chytriomyces hyalinus]
MSNTTLAPQDPLAVLFSYPQTVAFALTVGLTIEIAVGGLINAAAEYLSTDEPTTVTSRIIVVFNVLTIVYSSVTVWGSLVGERECAIGQFLALVLAHMFAIAFDVFMLVKTYAVGQFHRNILIGCIVVGAYRVCWGIVDIAKSYGEWDSEMGACIYYQNPITGTGYNSADILVDAFATIVALAYNLKYLRTSISQIRTVLVRENLLRSIIILSLNSFEIYAALSWTDQFNCTMAYLFQNYVYARCINAETVIKGIRRNAFLAPTVSAESHGSTRGAKRSRLDQNESGSANQIKSDAWK